MIDIEKNEEDTQRADFKSLMMSAFASVSKAGSKFLSISKMDHRQDSLAMGMTFIDAFVDATLCACETAKTISVFLTPKPT